MRMSPWPRVAMWNSQSNNKFRDKNDMLEVMLAKLGSPHNKLPPTIHIAGTNGKGSSLAMLRSIYEAAGYRVSSYSSPHILNFNERIYLAGSYISDEYIHDLIKRCKQIADDLNYEPGFFEGTTLMAFLAFSEVPADILIIETGMGGRLDSTNVIANPIATLITTIGLDHIEHLGNTIESIAAEKAGIMKTGCPCIIGAQQDSAYDTLFAIAEENNISTIAYEYDYGIDFNHYKQKDQGQGEYFCFLAKDQEIILPVPSLPGYHQIYNASAVIATIFAINDQFPIKIASIKQGLANTHWPGRLEKIHNESKKNILPDHIDLYLDGAHNDDGAAALGNWIRDQKFPTIIILGMTKNRDPNDFLKNMNCEFMDGLTVTVESEPNSFESSNLAQQINHPTIQFKHKYTLEEAFTYIRDNYNHDECTKAKLNVLVAGSLFLIADCYKLL